MNPVSHVRDRNLGERPAAEERRENAPADLAMQRAHRVDRAAAAKSEIGHVEGFAVIARILPAQCQQLAESDLEDVLRVALQVALEQRWIEAIKTGRHRRMGGEQITRARGRERHVEGLVVLDHECARALEYGKGRVTLIQMADLWLKTHSPEQSPSAQPEHQLLRQPQFLPAAVKFAGDAAMDRRVSRIVASRADRASRDRPAPPRRATIASARRPAP